MNKLMYIILITLVLTLSCGGNPGPTGPAGSSCSIEATDTGALISCDDGSAVEIQNGSDGDNGQDGTSVVIVCQRGKHGTNTCVRTK